MKDRECGYIILIMNILVTGACGRVGRHVVAELEQGHSIRLWGRVPPEERRGGGKSKHPFMKGDLLDADSLRRAVEGMDAVAHLAANPWFSATTFLTNAVGTYNILEACRAAGIKRFVMAGSDWGVAKSDRRANPPRYVPVDEEHPVRPNDEYGLSKAVNEVTAEMYAREYGMECAVMRITGVWEPGNTEKYAKADKTTTAADEVKFWWAYVDGRDVARAFRMAIEARDLPRYGTYFLSASDTTIEEPTMDAVRKFWPGVGVKREIPGNTGVLSVDAARKGFGFEPVHSWRNYR